MIILIAEISKQRIYEALKFKTFEYYRSTMEEFFTQFILHCYGNHQKFSKYFCVTAEFMRL